MVNDLFLAYDIIAQFKDLGILRSIDKGFAAFIYREEHSSARRLISILAGLLSYATTRANNVCIEIATPLAFFESVQLNLEPQAQQRFAVVCQDIMALLAEVDIPRLVKEASTISEFPELGNTSEPLVCYQGRLYLLRYWEAEEVVYSSVIQRLNLGCETVASGWLQNLSLFYGRFGDSTTTYGQQVALFTALRSMFSVITGGPGTGKTTVVAVLLGLYLQENPAARIALVAPTGKAQARLKEAVYAELEYLRVGDEVKELIKAVEFKTIHRLLGIRRNKPAAGGRLEYDLVVVDEASMVSILLFRQLFTALPLSTRLVLLGDRDQLAAVEGGAVLSDLCKSLKALDTFSADFCAEFGRVMSPELPVPFQAEEVGILQDAIAPLSYTFRFSGASGIGRMKDLLATDQAEFARFMQQGHLDYSDSLVIRDFTSSLSRDNLRDILSFIESWGYANTEGESRFLSYLRADTVAQALAIFAEFQIITLLNRGVLGVAGINQALISRLQLDPAGAKGLPVLIEKNDYQTGLFNGDIGMFWPDSAGDLKVYFPAEGAASGDASMVVREFSPAQLPEFSPAFAMTVHKAQGSGFGGVLLVIPRLEADIFTKELLYTAVTRAKHRIDVFCDSDYVVSAARKEVCRISGLGERFCRERKK